MEKLQTFQVLKTWKVFAADNHALTVQIGQNVCAELLNLQAGNFYVQLASEKNPERALAGKPLLRMPFVR